MKDKHGNPVPLAKRLDIPPLWLTLVLVLQTLAHRLVPLAPCPSPLTKYLGMAVVLLGLALIGWTARGFLRKDTPIHPRRKPRKLITDGPFAYSRNPIYLAMVMISLGAAFWLGSLLPLLGPPSLMLIIRKRFIDGEEYFIEKTFGAEWRAYTETVRRWI